MESVPCCFSIHENTCAPPQPASHRDPCWPGSNYGILSPNWSNHRGVPMRGAGLTDCAGKDRPMYGGFLVRWDLG